MTVKKNPASMGGGGDFPREFGMWFGGAGRAGHPATSRGAAILKKSHKEKELVGKERKKAIAKLSKQLAAKERLYRDKTGNLVRGKDRKKDIKKTHDTLGRKIRRGEERAKHKKYPERKKQRDLSGKRAIKEKIESAKKEINPFLRKGRKIRTIIINAKEKKESIARGKKMWADHKEKQLKTKAAKKEINPLIDKGVKVYKTITRAKKSKEYDTRKKQRKQNKKDIEILEKKGAKVYKKMTGKKYEKPLSARTEELREWRAIRKKYPY